MYDKVVSDLNPKQPDLYLAAFTFGNILHAGIDFYAHSNWVELGRTDLIDDGNDKWTLLQPFNLVKGVYIIQGRDENIPQGYNLTLNGKTVTVTNPAGTHPGLISGTVPYEPGSCPNSVSLGHWDSFFGQLPKFLTIPGSNKDKPGMTGYLPGVSLGLAQTKHEWCRLVNLVGKTYGDKGKQMLFNNWIGDNAKAQQTDCPPPLTKNHGVGWFTDDDVLHQLVDKVTNQTSGTYSFTVYNGIIDGSGSGVLVSIIDHSGQYWLCTISPPISLMVIKEDSPSV